MPLPRYAFPLPWPMQRTLWSPPRRWHWRRLCHVCALWLLCAMVLPTGFLGLSTTVRAQGVIPPPTFSVPHGYITAPFQLTLAAAADLQIRYTTDFSTPSATNGTLYTGPLTLDGTTVVRAVAYDAAFTQSSTVTQSYIFLAQVQQQSNSPGSGWPTTFAPPDSNGGPYPAYYEMAPEIVNDPTNAGQIEPALRALPAVSLVTDAANLWDPAIGIYTNASEKGREWERPLSLEWLDPTGASTGFAVNAGGRIHGQASRRPHRMPKKSLRLYFRNGDYGVANLSFNLFPETDAVATFDRILFRGGGNRSFPYYDRDQRREADYISDEFSRRIFLEMGWLTAHGTYVHLYLNGQYWGLYNLTERLDDKFLIAYLGETENDYDFINPDEDFNYAPTADPGTTEAWDALHALVDVPQVDTAIYQQVLTQLDVVNLADYMILLHYIANTDWPAHNWYTYRKRIGPDTRFRMIIWDSDTSLNKLNENMTLADAPGTPARLFHKLLTNAEFRQLVADRFYHYLEQNQGLLTPAHCSAVYTTLANTVDTAIIGESARWGSYARKVYPQVSFAEANKALPAYFYSRAMALLDADPTNVVPDNEQKQWLQVRDEKLTLYCPQRTGVVISQYVQNGWYQTTLRAPTFSQEGGSVAAGFTLTLDNALNSGAGTIYYTVDGGDPRMVSGALAAGALDGADLATVAINTVTTVRARVLDNGNWSPLHEGTFYPPQPFANLLINEIHYNPVAPAGLDGNLFEFVELYNNGDVPLRLDHSAFSRGFTYEFPAGATIAPGGYFVLSPNAEQFQARYGFAPDGVFSGNLSNGGEALELRDALGALIDFVDYDDVAPWPTTPDGTGPSLALVQPNLDNSVPTHWAPSLVDHGTPGQPNGLLLPNQPPVVTIISPAANTRVVAGDLVTIQATASDTDGTIQTVAFLADSTLLCTVTAAPYECTFTPGAGAVSLTAVATDDRSAATTAATVLITVVVPQAPSVTITSPTADATIAQGITVTIQATASDSDGTIQQVEFLVDELLLCTVVAPPYRCDVVPTPGLHTLTARATDNHGLRTTATLSITVTAPAPLAISVTQPSANSTIPLGTEVTLAAAVSGGPAERIEFFVGEALLCRVATAPYRCVWRPTAMGTYALKATVYGTTGAVDSALLTVTVGEPIDGTAGNVIYLPLLMR